MELWNHVPPQTYQNQNVNFHDLFFSCYLGFWGPAQLILKGANISFKMRKMNWQPESLFTFFDDITLHTCFVLVPKNELLFEDEAAWNRSTTGILQRLLFTNALYHPNAIELIKHFLASKLLIWNSLRLLHLTTIFLHLGWKSNKFDRQIHHQVWINSCTYP